MMRSRSIWKAVRIGSSGSARSRWACAERAANFESDSSRSRSRSFTSGCERAVQSKTDASVNISGQSACGRALLAAALDADPYQLADAVAVDRLERIAGQDLLVEVLVQELALGVVARIAVA